MNYWIFKCDPNLYRLSERMEDSNPEISWTVTRYKNEIQSGDIAFLWQTGSRRGIYAVMMIETAPQDIPELLSEQPYWNNSDKKTYSRVIGKLIYRRFYLSSLKLKQIEDLASLSVFHGVKQGTNFRVTQNEGAVLMSIIDKQVAQLSEPNTTISLA